MRPGPRNLITDVAGLQVGNAHCERLASGCSVLLAERPFTAAVHVMGGAPGTREADLLAQGQALGGRRRRRRRQGEDAGAHRMRLSRITSA